MLPLAQFSRPVRIAARLLWGVGLAGLAAFTLAAGFGLGDARSSGFEAPYICLHLLFGAVGLLRAALVGSERLAWWLIGIAHPRSGALDQSR